MAGSDPAPGTILGAGLSGASERGEGVAESTLFNGAT